MKTIFFITLAITCSLLGSCVGISTPFQDNQKVYISRRNVRITKAAFSITTRKGTFTTKTLRFDKGRLFVLKKDIFTQDGNDHVPEGPYYCRTCRREFRDCDEFSDHYR